MIYRKINLGRQGNMILALMLIHFVFFGYLCNVYIDTGGTPNIGERILYLYQVMFSPYSYFSAIILFLIIFFLTFREPFFEYGMRNSIWTLPFIIVESWIWYWFSSNEFDLAVIGVYFTRIESYITILSLLAIILAGTFSGAIAKEQYKLYKEKAFKITTTEI